MTTALAIRPKEQALEFRRCTGHCCDPVTLPDDPGYYLRRSTIEKVGDTKWVSENLVYIGWRPPSKGGWVEHHGEFYDFGPLEMSPVPENEIPIFVGGVSPPALRRAAAMANGWISDLHTFSELKALIADVKAFRADQFIEG